VLSKLEFFESGATTRKSLADNEALWRTLERHFCEENARVTPVSAGTLSVCFRLDLAGAPRFLKTHMQGAVARANLAKEIAILQRLYGHEVVRDSFEVVPAKGDVRLSMLMTMLTPLPSPMDADAALATVRDLAAQFGNWRPAELAARWDFENYIVHGERAVSALKDQAFLGARTAGEFIVLLKLLRAKLDSLPRSLCHGDFGPKNIMTDGERPVAIDWEDAFWGVRGYDYLYWLTFMDNRAFMLNAAYGRTGLDREIERAILAIVVLLKSFLAVKSGAYLSHAVPIEMRITEVLELH